jgi:peptidyl-tRNA hydrolase
MEEDYRMYCIVSKEALKLMNGNRGKLGTQTGHAYLHCFWDAEERFPESAKSYKDSLKNGTRAYKITLYVETTKELEVLHDLYKDLCGVSLVVDQAHTVFDKPTMTCLGIGPIQPSKREDIVKNLKGLL